MSLSTQERIHADGRAASSRIMAAIALMRPKQWVKNGFILVPLFFSGHGDLSLIVSALIATISFCLLSSTIYILNDLCDRFGYTSSDRPLATTGLLTAVRAS